MDKLNEYRATLERVLRDLTRVPFAHGKIEIQTVFDRETDRYLVMLVGWNGVRRMHGCLVQVDIIEGKLWVQRDGTEYGVARELSDCGIPKSEIVLGFRSQKERQFSEFAVA